MSASRTPISASTACGSATDIVQWTQQQAMIGKAKALAGQAVGKVADGVKSGLSKLGLSKVAARQEGAVAAAAA